MLKRKNNITKIWDVIKEALGEMRCNNQKVTNYK